MQRINEHCSAYCILQGLLQLTRSQPRGLRLIPDYDFAAAHPVQLEMLPHIGHTTRDACGYLCHLRQAASQACYGRVHVASCSQAEWLTFTAGVNTS